MIRRAGPALGILFLLACSPDDPRSRGFEAPVHGITVSTHTDGRDWAWDPMIATLKEIREVGAGWVAVHPYAGIAANGELRYPPIDPARPPRHLIRPIREAHAQGLKILVKPHLAHWGSPFSWRGEIAFRREADWQRFWRGYERWIVGLAAAAREADGFVIGTELDLTLDHERAWRRVVAAVRRETRAPLTYASNWSDFERVPFWDASDAIGIQAYFPLVDDERTDVASIRAGWSDWMRRLRRFADQHDRPVLFTELGYNRSFSAPLRPWDARTDGEAARSVQQSCMREALRAIRAESSVVGAFLWKWFPLPHPVGRDFQLATPGMKAVIRDAWAGAQPAPASGFAGSSMSRVSRLPSLR